MKKLALIILATMALMVLGCSKTEEGGQDTAYDNIMSLINADPEGWISVYAAAGEEEGDTLDTLGVGLKTPPVLYKWFRRPQDRDISVDINFVSEDTAIVTLTGSVDGKLFVAAIMPPDSLLYTHEKQFEDTLTRIFEFVRDTDTAHYGGWRLYAASGHSLYSIPYNTVNIDSIRLVVNDGLIDTVITDPLEPATVDEVLKVAKLTPITAYVWASTPEWTPSSVLAYLHIWLGGKFRRLKMFYDSTLGCYRRSFLAPNRPGVTHLFFDVLTRETIADTSAPYDSRTWGIVYLVTP
ncbi:MAG: hypothetical protein DRQ10_00715 [Candidatus Hydrothermota bacterium]|nr:MAG: hypothetical protein DRQ10_00715 [Candidatus Hydrothermae bacterium]